MTNDPAKNPIKSDFATGLLIYSITAFIFFPLTRFLFDQTVNQDQLLHSFLVLSMAGALLVYEKRVRLNPVWELGLWSRRLLIISYVILITVVMTGWTLLMIPSFSCAVASAAIFVFGDQVKRFVAALVGAFTLFQGFVLALPFLDWPLRGVAAQMSGSVLKFLGREIEIRLYQLDEPALLLLSNGKEFLVAPECNGFGVTVSSLLLALLLVVFRRIKLSGKIGSFFLAGIIGLIGNTIRITIIVLLAPIVGEDGYHLMHEIVGTIVYYGTLTFIWWMILRLPTIKEVPPPSS
jgi:exosortase/archaeosortase family protein|tara:strand:+ start:35479 stop:36357 length:879 start_codon:yes stop_codon:yes gene_type:complete